MALFVKVAASRSIVIPVPLSPLTNDRRSTEGGFHHHDRNLFWNAPLVLTHARAASMKRAKLFTRVFGLLIGSRVTGGVHRRWTEQSLLFKVMRNMHAPGES